MNLNNDVDFIIAKATIEDAKAVVDFLNKVGGETDFLTFGLDEFPISVEEEQSIISECLEQDICLMLLAKINDEIVGQLFLEGSSLKRLKHIGTFGITVSKKYWGKSIGKKMILAAMEWAKSKDLSKIQLYVRTDNEAAVCMYKKLGFAIEGTISNAVRIDGIYFDNYVMGIIL